MTPATKGPFIHAGTAVGHRRFQTGSPVEVSLSAAFAAPRAGSVWPRTIFNPIYDPLDIVRAQFDVRTKGGLSVPFVPFETQLRYADRMGLRNVIVKPRQVGMSTINIALESALAITTPNLGILIITHLDETTETMRDTVKRFMRGLMARGWNLEFGKDNADELQILPTDTVFYFGTSGGSKDTGVGRSRTIQVFHASELAHWNGSDPGKTFSGITESVPDTGLVIAESTPNGAVGPFYGIFKGRNAYVKHFYPWFIESSRKLALPAGYQLSNLTDEEQVLIATYGLSHEQIAWRRWKGADLASQGLEFKQEYPEDEISCFTAGVRSAFPTGRLIGMMRRAEVTPFTVEAVPGSTWDPGGQLKIWQQPREGVHYIAAGDVGGGHRDGDDSVLMIGEQNTGQIVAVLAGKWQPETFGELSVLMARRYNEAYLSHESNGLGIGAVHKAVRELNYRNYHWEKRRDNSEGPSMGGQDMSPGFYITSYSRTPLLRHVIQAVMEDAVVCYEPELFRQMTAAQLTRGRTAGGWQDTISIPKEVHDDYLMAYAQFLALRRILVIDPATNRAKPMQQL